MPDEFKSINITGNAAAEITGGKRTRRSVKKKQGGGTNEVHSVSHVINNVKGVESATSFASTASTAALPNSNTWLRYPTDAPVPPRIIPNPSHVSNATTASNASNASNATTATNAFTASNATNANTMNQSGGSKHIKVELKKKIIPKRVHLNPKKADVIKQSKKHQTRKNRKVTLGISNLHKRITHAKKLHRKMKDMPIELLKDKLIKGGLIKANSKAPESVLRQIASDAAVVKNKAL